jgi:RecA/RadA recombinase
MVLPRNTFQVHQHSSASLSLQQHQEQQSSLCRNPIPPNATVAPSSSHHAVNATKRDTPPPTLDRRQLPSVVSVNNNNLPIIPTSALDLLKRQIQHDASRLALLLSLSTTTTTLPPLFLTLAKGITQVYGEAGSGKTQIGLSTCVSCVAASPNNIALHVSLGEGTSCAARLAQRLFQMATSRFDENAVMIDSLLQRIQTRALRNQEEIVNFVNQELPEMLASKLQIQLIVLDSIAGMFRTCNEEGYPQRARLLFDIASQLKRISHVYQIPILVMNQVSTNISNNTMVPALGVSWAACVNTSYRVERSERHTKENEKKESSVVFERKITLVHSSSYPETTIPFEIQASGVVAMI